MCDSQYKYRMGDVRGLQVDKDASLDKDSSLDKKCPKCTKFFKLKCKYCENEYCSRCIHMDIHNCSKMEEKVKFSRENLKLEPICASKILKI